MGIFGNQNNNQFLFLPKVGESIKVAIVGEVKRVKNDGNQFNYKKQGGVDVGYYDVIPVINEETGDEAELLMNVWKFYFQLKEMEGIELGDSIKIGHPENGKYTIEKA
jgi:hypothetical protein